MSAEKGKYINNRLSMVVEDSLKIKEEWPRWKDTVSCSALGLAGLGALWATQGIEASNSTPLALLLRSSDVFGVEAAFVIGGFGMGVFRGYQMFKSISPKVRNWSH